jgi:hypothetical protein
MLADILEKTLVRAIEGALMGAIWCLISFEGRQDAAEGVEGDLFSSSYPVAYYI